MDGWRLTNAAAWSVYDKFLSDDPVQFFSEMPELDERFCALSAERHPVPDPVLK